MALPGGGVSQIRFVGPAQYDLGHTNREPRLPSPGVQGRAPPPQGQGQCGRAGKPRLREEPPAA